MNVTVNPDPAISGTPPSGVVGSAYTTTLTASGGTAPIKLNVASGSLPPGLTFNATTGVISGTPTSTGTYNFVAQAIDASDVPDSVTAPETIVITMAAAPLVVVGNPPPGTVGAPYSAMIGVSGGTAPYSCAISTGTLPAGLTLGTACLVSGTPTVSGTANVIVKATDSANPMQTTTGSQSITISAASPLTLTSPPSATVGTPYTGTIGVNGGTAPYTCAVVSGTFPAGLTLSTNCVVSGTPTTPGTPTVTVQATDSSNPANSSTGPITLTVKPASATLTLSAPPVATVATPYTGTIGVSGGTVPYTCTASAAGLPPGLTLGTGCVVSGTPTAAGTTPVMITATDSGSPTATTTGPVNITVQPIPPLTLAGSLPNATLGQPYTQTLHANGGVGPYTYAVTAGALSAGLSLSPSGVITGTPTAVGASSFTVTATDNESTPQTASLPLVLMVVYPTATTDAELKGPYAFLFQGYDDVAAGVLAFQTATAGSFTADGTGALNAGELDSNHQGSNPSGTTISSNAFLGTYTIGTDNRGSLTITTLNADGTTANTSTYAIAVKAPVAPSTISAKADLIEFDNDQVRGTKGSGIILAQQPAAFAAGLNGNYAFGLSGDTPCLPTCTVGIIAGPAASVGRFTADASGVMSGGMGDENVASANYPNSTLTGSYGAADANGRLQITMQTSGAPAAAYPSDFAVYLVSANQAFVLSTDKHSAYILLSGSAQLQTQSNFDTASMSGPFVGYENSPTNPGLVGSTLQNTLNLSTATLFRGTADGAGTCTITNVDVGGTTGLVNGLSGQGSGAPTLNALLGTYQSTGNSACTVSADGRGVLNYPVPNTVLAAALTALGLPATPPPARVLYLYGPNQGYFLETGYAGLGNLEAQTGAPFTTATLNGTFIFGTSPASSLASTNGSGIFTADGAGHATTTLDLNVGVGTINVLQLGTSGTSNYTLTDATAGRYLLGADTVIYAISPDRFVLLDTSALTTSPSFALLY